MTAFNKVIIVGNLTGDVELRYTSGGTAVASMNVAVNNRYTSNGETKEDVCFVPVTVWGKQAENCSEYLYKGSSVLVEGRLKQNNWETDEGQKRKKLEVTAEKVQFLSKRTTNTQPTNASSGDENIPF